MRRYRKEIFEGYEYNVEITRFTDINFLNMVGMDVYWFYPNSVSDAWAETKDIIKAQAARVLGAQQPVAGQLADADEEKPSDDDDGDYDNGRYDYDGRYDRGDYYRRYSYDNRRDDYNYSDSSDSDYN